MATIEPRERRESVNAGLGETIVVRLDENPTTGYRWALDRLDSDLLESEGSDFQIRPESGIGAGGLRTFAFKALSRGRGTIELKLWRGWQGSDSVIERREVVVTIK